jgi:hypothetical protein
MKKLEYKEHGDLYFKTLKAKIDTQIHIRLYY